MGGGLANVSPLTYGIASDNVEQESHVSDQYVNVLDYSNAPGLSLELNVAASQLEDFEESEAVPTTSANKRPASCVPQLINNKRKHLEKALSAAQRQNAIGGGKGRCKI